MHNRRNLARALRSRRDKRRRRMTVRGRRTWGVWMRRVCLRDPPLCNQWGLIVGLPNLASPVKFRWRRPAGTRIRGGKTDMGLVKWRRCQTCMSSASVTRRHTKKARRETLAVLSSKPGSHRAWIANFWKATHRGFTKTGKPRTIVQAFLFPEAMLQKRVASQWTDLASVLRQTLEKSLFKGGYRRQSEVAFP